MSPYRRRSTAKRCRDKHLEEALLLARALSEELRVLGEAEARPLLRCVLAFQLEASGSSSAFHKLEQVCNNAAPGREAPGCRSRAAKAALKARQSSGSSGVRVGG